MHSSKKLILGVTASGKGRLAFDLAKEMAGEIISVDSMKVYRRMNIGTAKPPPEALEQVRYHLIDVVEPSEPFNVARFLELAYEAIKKIEERSKPVIAVGGTALYIKAMLYGLFEGPGSDEQIRRQLQKQAEAEGLEKLHKELAELDPEAAKRINPNDAKRIIRAIEVHTITGRTISSFQQQFDAARPVHNWTIIGLRRERTIENQRINARVKKMMTSGLVDEAKSLLAEEKSLSRQAGCAIGYAEIIEHLQGKSTLQEAIEQIKKSTRRLAKNQRTWFKRFKYVNWLDIKEDESPEDIISRVKEKLNEDK
ncbi:tRNA (adenosine(37)-N6)-dimethylallyltransferase MiaA [Planctomycetota bacterium]